MKSNVLKRSAAIAIGASLIASAAYAATEASTSVSNQSKSVMEKLREKVKAQLLVNYYGPGIGNLSDHHTPEATGATAATANSTMSYVENQLRLGAKIAPGTSLGVTNQFDYTATAEHTSALRAPFIHLIKSNIVASGPLSVGSDARIYMPLFRNTNGAGRESTHDWRFRVSPYANYTVGRWTAGLGTYARYNIEDGKYNAAMSTDYIDLYGAPSLNYQVSPKVSVGILYEMFASRAVNTNGNGWQNIGTDLEPNVSIDLTPSLNINPWINFYTGNSVTADTMALGFYLTATFL